MTTHTTISGHTIEFHPTADVATFLARVEALAADPKTRENDLVGLVYSRENPILDHSIFPARGAVTKEVLEDPVYHVLCDILARKRMATDGIDRATLAKHFTLSAADAARLLDVNSSAVRQAIAARRLPSWLHEGQHLLNPAHVAAFQTGMRGPQKERHPLIGEEVRIAFGRMPGATMRITVGGLGFFSGEDDEHGVDVTATEAQRTMVKTGTVRPGWSAIHVLSTLERGGKTSERYALLRPALEPAELRVGDTFYVRGNFTVEETENNAARAKAKFESDLDRLLAEYGVADAKELRIFTAHVTREGEKETFVVEHRGIERSIRRALFDELKAAGVAEESPADRWMRGA